MRSVRVITNETCDLRCSFCDTRRPHERASVAAGVAVRQRIDAAADAQEVVLTGGEPTLRRDLATLVRRAGARGARVVLETHGKDIDAARARALLDAGLRCVRLHLPATGTRLDAVTGGVAVWPAVQASFAALRDAGIAVEVTVPIVAANVADVVALPEQLTAAHLTPARLWIRVPLVAPDPTTLAQRAALGVAVEAVADAARVHEIPTSLDPATFVPPCQLPHPSRVAHLYRLNTGGAARAGYRRTAACQPCTVADRCPGMPTDAPAFADARPQPLRDDRTRRRLTQIATPQAQAEREWLTRELFRRADGGTAHAHVIRINFRCNQACQFCFVSTHLPAVADQRITLAIQEAAAQGAVVVLSGGEPTLNPRLPAWVALAKRSGAPEVELQTNATLLAGEGRAAALAEAGLDRAFVSLHAADAATSDGLTGAPGTYVRTTAGLDALSRTSVAVRINYVLCRDNAAQFPTFVDQVASRWPRAAITVSFVAMSTDLVPRTAALVPRYADVLPALQQGLARARVHGLEIGGFESMCGIPLCLAPVDPDQFRRLAEPPAGKDASEFVHPPPCAGCSLNTRCFGLRRGYAELHGWAELRPVGAA